jgi:UPF0755 protein
MKKIILSLLCLFSLAILLTALSFAFYAVIHPSTGEPEDVVVNIPHGSTVKKIAFILEEQGVIHGRRRFQILAKLNDAEHKIKWGEYHFALPMAPMQILHKITRGETIAYAVTIPEGSTIFEVARLMQEAELCAAQAILNKATESSFVSSMGITGDSLEGYLFPETYKFSKGTAPEIILRSMMRRFDKIFTQDMSRQAEEMGLTKKEVVILASMVEKEASLSSEKPIIAAVFLNRLQKGMRLACDPTVIYGIRLENPDFRGRLRTKHLRQSTPYNTYLNVGLPPGPISNPGLESLKAVVHPAQADYLYFVSKNDGTHQFSKSLGEHNKAVAKYQKKSRK